MHGESAALAKVTDEGEHQEGFTGYGGFVDGSSERVVPGGNGETGPRASESRHQRDQQGYPQEMTLMEASMRTRARRDLTGPRFFAEDWWIHRPYSSRAAIRWRIFDWRTRFLISAG